MLKIAFCGKAGVGKTTAAFHLSTRHGFLTLSFANKLKEICEDLWPDNFMWEKPRKMLQNVGDVLRTIDKDVWVNYLMRRIEGSHCSNIVVDDVRYLNEAEALKKKGFTLIRIVGPQRGVSMSPDENNHVSETEQDNIEVKHTISNTKTICDLYESIEDVLHLERRVNEK